MTDNSVPSLFFSMYSTPTRSISSAQIVPYRSSLTAPFPPSHQQPALTGLTNSALEPTALWGRTNTLLDEGLMESDLKGRRSGIFPLHCEIPNPTSESSKAYKKICALCTHLKHTHSHHSFPSILSLSSALLLFSDAHSQGSSSKPKAIV